MARPFALNDAAPRQSFAHFFCEKWRDARAARCSLRLASESAEHQSKNVTRRKFRWQPLTNNRRAVKLPAPAHQRSKAAENERSLHFKLNFSNAVKEAFAIDFQAAKNKDTVRLSFCIHIRAVAILMHLCSLVISAQAANNRRRSDDILHLIAVARFEQAMRVRDCHAENVFAAAKSIHLRNAA